MNSLGADISSLPHRQRDSHCSIRCSLFTCKECIKSALNVMSLNSTYFFSIFSFINIQLSGLKVYACFPLSPSNLNLSLVVSILTWSMVTFCVTLALPGICSKQFSNYGIQTAVEYNHPLSSWYII